MTALLVIPARSGSQGIPQKNLQEVGGIPLIVRAIRTAQKATHVGKIVVSTDGEEIAKVAQEAGAEVVVRPEEISGDTASSESALLHVLEQLDTELEQYQTLVMVQCTSPFTEPEDIDGCIQMVEQEEGRCDSAFAACRFHYYIWRQNDHGAFGINHVPSERKMRQQRAPEYLEAGSVYAMNLAGFRLHKHRFFGRIGIHEVPECRVNEIDTPDDLYNARKLAHTEYLKPGSRVFIDLDETICVTPDDRDYSKAVPIPENIAKINALHRQGHHITCWTARGSAAGKCYEELTAAQLKAWGVEYDYLITGKPVYDLLIDDRATTWIPDVESV